MSNAYWFFGDLVIVHVGGAETGDRFCMVEFLMPPDEWTPLHVHRRDSQTTYALDGELTIHLGDETRILKPGDCILQPAGVRQTGHVTSPGPARVLDVNSPAGFDEFIVAAGEPAEELTLPPPDRPQPDVERLTAIAAAHGVDLVGPPGALP